MKGRAFRGILFDLDETLHSREAAFWSWIESEARSAGSSEALNRRQVAELDRCGRGDKQNLLRYLASIFGWAESEDAQLQRFRDGLSSFVRMEAGVGEMLTRLAGEYRLGLVTNGSSKTQRAKLAALRIEHFFDPVVISEEAGVKKPDVRIFTQAIASWGVPRESVLFVGDDPVSDIQGAHDAGMCALRVGHESGIPSVSVLEAWLHGTAG